MAQSTYYIHSMTYGMNMENPHTKLTRETKKKHEHDDEEPIFTM